MTSTELQLTTPSQPADGGPASSKPPFDTWPWRAARKAGIWAAFFLTVYVLLDFLSLAIITFILCYILNTAAVHLVDRFGWRRRLVITGIFTVILIGLVIGVTVLLPKVIDEGKKLYQDWPQTVEKVEKLLTGLIESTIYGKVQALGVESTLDDLVGVAAKKATSGFNTLVKLVFHLFLSLILAFLILFDLPKMRGGLRMLASSRLRPFYEEIGPHLLKFFEILGKVFEAQVIIATVNTTFTFFGLIFLGIPFFLVMSIGVFFGGFIPVAGVFISSIPIVLVALSHGGFALALKAVGLITFIHIMEAYVLNPQIMGEHLAIHPVVVLCILLLGESFFGVWGLLLGVPVSIYVFRDLLSAAAEATA